jgi:predicted RNase H-like HicB family nuclease
MDKYEIIIYWSNEDKVFIAEAPELPGCIAHGDTHEVALINIKTAMELWMETAKEFDDPIHVPKGQRLAFA